MYRFRPHPSGKKRLLRNNRYKSRPDDPLIRRQESQSPHTGRRHNRPVGGIPQRRTNRGYLGGNFDSQRNNLKSRIGIEFVQQFIECDIASIPAFTEQNGDFQQRYRTDCNRLMPTARFPQDSRLLPRSASWAQPAIERRYAYPEGTEDSVSRPAAAS